MNVIEAPEIWQGTIHRTYDDRNERGIFLAGGITGCPDWQSTIICNVRDYTQPTLLNPRRANFPIDDPNAAASQIRWERLHLDHADAIVFWFPKETLCPIVLFELGAALYGREDTPLFIGTDPEYQRRQDVIIQTSLIRPELKVTDSLDGLTNLMLAYVNAPGPGSRRFRGL